MTAIVERATTTEAEVSDAAALAIQAGHIVYVRGPDMALISDDDLRHHHHVEVGTLAIHHDTNTDQTYVSVRLDGGWCMLAGLCSRALAGTCAPAVRGTGRSSKSSTKRKRSNR